VDGTCVGWGSFSRKFSRIGCLSSFHCQPRSFRWPIRIYSLQWPWHHCGSRISIWNPLRWKWLGP
jgi:hypothetical protein